MKKLLALGAMALLVAACGGKTPEVEEPTTPEAPAAEDAVEEAAEEAPVEEAAEEEPAEEAPAEEAAPE